MRLLFPLLILLASVWSPLVAQNVERISIRVDAKRELGLLRPAYSYFGYDEPNYTYMKDGKRLLSQLAAASPVPVYIRVHNLLTTGDGTAALKWGSTNAYTEDDAGKPRYDWTIVDRIFDTLLERRMKPLVEIGFMQRFILFLGHPMYALAVILASLLAAFGVGSALSAWGTARFGTAGYVRRVVGLLAGLLALYAVILTPLFHALLGLPLVARILIAVVLVSGPGLLMGALLPSGVRVANEMGRGMVAWGWGLNGAASVVGSILAMALSMNFGFTLSLVAGIVVYLVGMTLLVGIRRPQAV